MRASTIRGCAAAFGAATAALGFAFGTSCSDDGCSSERDCPSGMNCENRVCVLAGGSGGFRDGGPQPDLGPRDTGVDSDGGGGGMTGDGGPITGSDGGDAMPIQAFDGGGIGGVDATTFQKPGIAAYGELQGASQEFTAFGEFIDPASATYAKQELLFEDSEGGNCTVTTIRLISGTPAGLTAARIEFATDERGLVRELLPDPARPGRFIPQGILQPGMFAQPGDLSVEIQSNGSPGSLADFLVNVPKPRLFFGATSPPAGAPVNMLAGVSFLWSVTPPGFAVVEAYDANRDVVLRCETLDDGTYTIPIEAIRAWYTASPVAPGTLELRHEESIAATVPIEGRTETLPASFVVTQGARWAVF